MTTINITQIPSQRVEFIDPRTGLLAREWYRFFVNMFLLVGNGTNDVTLVDLQVSLDPEAIAAKYDELVKLVDQTGFGAPVDSLALPMFDPLEFGSPIPLQQPTPFGKGATLRQMRTTLTLNSANTDIATIGNLPSKYLVTAFRVFDASTSLAASGATLGVFTAAAAGGTAIVSLATLTALSAASKVTAMTIAASADYQTAGTLYIRNGTAHGGAATVSVQLEILDLSSP